MGKIQAVRSTARKPRDGGDSHDTEGDRDAPLQGLAFPRHWSRVAYTDSHRNR
jgi:hypothetical protein